MTQFPWATGSIGPDNPSSTRPRSRTGEGRAPTTPDLEKEVCAVVRHMAAAAPVLSPALWTAARFGRVEGVRRALAEKVDIEERGGQAQSSPLSTATFHGHQEVAQVLLEHGADASAKNNTGAAPLHHVALYGSLPMLLLLLDHGAEVEAKTNLGQTPLHFAALALHGHEAQVLLLLEHGAEVSSKSDDGGTPLHSAAFFGDTLMARVLLRKGADLQSKTDDGRTAEDIATARSHPQVAAMLKAETERREAVHRARCEAFAMGCQERRGAESWVQELDEGVMRMVLEQV